MYHRKSVLFLIFMITGYISAIAQIPNLRTLILDHAKRSACYPDEGDNLVVDLKKIDDIANGYYHLEFAMAGCGCTCSNSIGAYKKSTGEYVILSNEKGQCSYQNGLSSNVSFEELMPDSFGLQTFFKDSIGKPNEKYPALFYLKAEIPRKGTETIFHLELIPIGMKIFQPNGLCYKIQQHQSILSMDYLYDYNDLSKSFKDKNTIKYLRNGQYKKISTEDKKTIEEMMKKDQESNGEMARLRSYDEIKKNYQYIYYVYTWYKKLTYTTLVMDWDTEKGRFYIKEKKGKPKSLTFEEFLDEYYFFWHIMC